MKISDVDALILKDDEAFNTLHLQIEFSNGERRYIDLAMPNKFFDSIQEQDFLCYLVSECLYRCINKIWRFSDGY